MNRVEILCTLLLASTGATRAYDDVEKRATPPPHVLDKMPPPPCQNLTVIVLPHSHDDTGWQRTVDEYYEEQVRYIYDTVVDALRDHPDRRFIFVETAFLSRWWVEQPIATQATFRRLVDAGQIEFANGGWCMADDASPSIDDQIDQLTLGHAFLHSTFGSIPKIAWHIDPFG